MGLIIRHSARFSSRTCQSPLSRPSQTIIRREKHPYTCHTKRFTVWGHLKSTRAICFYFVSHAKWYSSTLHPGRILAHHPPPSIESICCVYSCVYGCCMWCAKWENLMSSVRPRRPPTLSLPRYSQQVGRKVRKLYIYTSI